MTSQISYTNDLTVPDLDDVADTTRDLYDQLRRARAAGSQTGDGP